MRNENMNSVDAENMNVDEAGDQYVVRALKELEKIKQKFHFIRSKLILSEAVHVAGSSATPEDQSFTGEELSNLEDNIDRLCIQENALKFSLQNDTIHNIISSGAQSSDLQEHATCYLHQEIEIVSLSMKIREESLKLQQAQNNLTESLRMYMAYEKSRHQQFKENSTQEDADAADKVKRELKEIRFMQLMIPRIISATEVDLREVEWLGKLCKEIRDPILSLDDLE